MSTRQSFPLSQSWLCPDCESIGNCAMQCVCGNRHGLLNLASVLDRDPVAAEVKGIMGMYNQVMQERVWTL